MYERFIQDSPKDDESHKDVEAQIRFHVDQRIEGVLESSREDLPAERDG